MLAIPFTRIQPFLKAYFMPVCHFKNGNFGAHSGEEMPEKEIDTLPDGLQAWIYSIRQDLKLEKAVEQQPKEITPDPRLMKHLDELAQTADLLAHQVNRLLRYKDYDDIEVMGDILGHLWFWRKSNGTIVAESTYQNEEFVYAEQPPIDPYLASILPKCYLAFCQDHLSLQCPNHIPHAQRFTCPKTDSVMHRNTSAPITISTDGNPPYTTKIN